jgi:hypothetical protein
VQCFARTQPGNDVADKPVTAEGFGEDGWILTLVHDFKSLQKAPVWLDLATVSSCSV